MPRAIAFAPPRAYSPPMELHQLRSFKAVAEEGNLGRAAARVFASPPSVSAHVKALEEELGVQLFTRTSRGMDITAAGRELLARAGRVLAECDGLEQAARGLREDVSGEVRLGLNTDFAFLRTERLLAALGERHPRLRVHFFQSASGLVLREVRSRTLDAGFVFYDEGPADVRFTMLEPVPLHVVAPQGWAERVRGLRAEDLERLANLPWIWPACHCPYGEGLAELFQSLGLTPEIAAEADNENVIKGLLAAGRGLALLREDETAEEVAAGRGLDLGVLPQLRLSLNLVHLASREDDPVIRALIECVAIAWAPNGA